jgi:hypothetical protein
MRRFLWLTGLTLGMVWASSAHAQTSAGASTITNILKFPKSFNINVTPNIVNNSPMDYRNQNTPIGGTMYRPTNQRLSNYFFKPARTNFISSTTNFGRSVFPTPAQMQAAAPGYFKAFQMYRAPFIQP